MRERPILFTGAMVTALLEDRKTQTRRIIKASDRFDALLPSKAYPEEWVPWIGGEAHHSLFCPYGVPDDRLWVRERGWMSPSKLAFVPFVGNAPPPGDTFRTPGGEAYHPWPSIHMPRWASRITLRITDVRAERLQDISEADALAEGIICENVIVGASGASGHHVEQTADRFFNGVWDDEAFEDPVSAYAALWKHINGPASWDDNPWVWAVSFERIDSKHDVAPNQA